jgi:hypothetical protein
MRKTLLVIIFLFLLPNIYFAGDSVGVCSRSGFTVLTVNGVFTNEAGAKANKEGLELLFGKQYKGETLRVDYLHNESHLGGLGDIFTSIRQGLFDNEATEGYDMTEMLFDASEKVQTQKLLLVAHSQGNFYANSFYDLVADKEGGVPLQSLRVYGVANPAGRVAGSGLWLTSDTDKVIAGIVGRLPTKKITPPNTHIELAESDDSLGHSFTDVYLKYRGAQVVADITRTLEGLRPNDVQNENERCIDPPKLTLLHKVEGLAFAALDPVSEKVVSGGIQTITFLHSAGTVIAEASTKALIGIGNATLAVADFYITNTFDGLAHLDDASRTLGNAAVRMAGAVAGGVAGVGKAIVSAFGFDPSAQTAAVAANTADPSALLTVGQSDAQIAAPSPSEEPSPKREEQTLRAETSSTISLPNQPAPVPATPAEESVATPEPPTQKSAALSEQTVATPAPETAPVRLSPSGGGGGGVTNPQPTTNSRQQETQTSTPADTTAPSAPTVLTSVSQTFTSTSVTLSGTAEAGSVISTDFSSATTSANVTTGAWSITLTFGQGTTTIKVYATDAAGNRLAGTTLSVSVDSVAPDITLASATCDNSIGSSDCVVATTTLAFSWSSGAGDVAYYTISQNGTVSTTTATSTSVSGSDGSTYTFAVSARDSAGNSSATSTKAVTAYTSPVVINEIAWAGTSASTQNDEWIELYNRTDKTISLSDFVLYAADLSPYMGLSGTVAAGSYFLIERTNDNTVSTIAADLVLPFSGNGSSGLSNSGEQLILAVRKSNATTTLDQTPACGSWCAGSASSYTTMERYDTGVSGSSAGNWGTAISAYIKNGSDANGSAIQGTPKARNGFSYLPFISGSAPASAASSVNADTTLSSSRSPYLLIPDQTTISSGVTVTLGAGTIIKLPANGSSWVQVNGSLVANGTASSPVVFTSFYDDTYGGDTNGDGSSTSPSAGNWKRIFINTTSTGSSLTHTRVRYGGQNNISDTVAKQGAVGVSGVTATFNNLAVEYSNFHGIALESSNSTVSNSYFSSSTNSSTNGTGIYISGGSPTISGSTFAGNYRGADVSAATPTFTSNTFTNNTQEAVKNTGVLGSFQGNASSGNGLNAIVIVPSSTITSGNATTTLHANATMPYLIKGTATLALNSTLVFDQGVVVKGWDSRQSDYGFLDVASGAKLYATSTSASDIIFTSVNDNSVGGVTESSSASSTVGDWRGIKVQAGGMLDLSGFTIRYAGSRGLNISNGDPDGAVTVVGNASANSGRIASAFFDQNGHIGLSLSSVSNFLLSGSTLKSHTKSQGGGANGTAIYSTGSTANFSDITFSSNTTDVRTSGTNTLTCTNCGTPVTSPANLFSN